MLLCYQTISELDTVLEIYNFEKQILSLLLHFYLPSLIYPFQNSPQRKNSSKNIDKKGL